MDTGAPEGYYQGFNQGQGYNTNNYGNGQQGQRQFHQGHSGQFNQGKKWGHKGGPGGVKKKAKKGNAFLHLAQFTSEQQLGLFAPEVQITIEAFEYVITTPLRFFAFLPFFA